MTVKTYKFPGKLTAGYTFTMRVRAHTKAQAIRMARAESRRMKREMKEAAYRIIRHSSVDRLD
jgi:predicted phage tail protein